MPKRHMLRPLRAAKGDGSRHRIEGDSRGAGACGAPREAALDSSWMRSGDHGRFVGQTRGRRQRDDLGDNVSPADFLREESKRIAIAHSSYTMVDLEEWLRDDRTGERRFAQTGSLRLTNYDDMRHSPKVAADMAARIITTCSRRNWALDLVERSGGRGGLTVALLGELEAASTGSLTTFSQRTGAPQVARENHQLAGNLHASHTVVRCSL